MTRKPELAVAIIATFCLTAAMFLIVPVTSQYDPWLDYNEDGYIGIDDIFSTASSFGAEGDPTKNVNVTNWPIAPETTVWYNQPITTLISDFFNYSGFGYLHILLDINWAGPGSSLEFQVRGVVWDFSHANWRFVIAYSTTIAEPRDYLAVTIPVPSQSFYFRISPISGGGNVFLSFYLTWA